MTVSELIKLLENFKDTIGDPNVLLWNHKTSEYESPKVGPGSLLYFWHGFGPNKESGVLLDELFYPLPEKPSEDRRTD